METLTLTRQEIADMTGRKLIEAIGLIDKYGGLCNNDHVSFVLNGTEWTAYTTRGRGRSSGTTYVHIIVRSSSESWTPTEKIPECE